MDTAFQSKPKRQRVLITGCSRGIGQKTALKLAEGDYDLVLTSRNAAALTETAGQVANKGRQPKTFIGDIAVEREILRLKEFCLSELGGIDILINNAGVWCEKPTLLECGLSEIEYVFRINFGAAFLLTRELLPIMIRNSFGIIVMVSSISGFYHLKHESIYGMTKHLLNDFVQYLNLDFKDKNIRAISICPGLVNTDMGHSLKPPNPEAMIDPRLIADWIEWLICQPPSIRIDNPITITPSEDPWKSI